MTKQLALTFLEAYNKFQNDFDQESCIGLFGERAGYNIWEKFEANGNQFPLWMLGDTERAKLAEHIVSYAGRRHSAGFNND